MKKTSGATKKILIVQADFYKDISKMLLEGAINEIKKNNFEYEVITVSGALEIPIAISMKLNKNNSFIGFIALGCVIRGETSHYEIVCNESARGLMNIAMNYNVAIGNGIITTENQDQAIERADQAKLNKGGFAVRACLNLIKINQPNT